MSDYIQPIEPDYCGCCGNQILEEGYPEVRLWCGMCAVHVAPAHLNRPVWERTYESVHGVPCPLQVK